MKNWLTYLVAFTILIVCCCLATIVNTFAEPDVRSGYVVWRSDTDGITLTYPGDWRIDKKPETYDVPCILEAPAVDETGQPDGDSFGAFIMPVYIGQGYFEDINTLVEAWEDKFKNDWVEFNITGPKKVESANGQPAYELVYAVTDEDDLRINWAVWLILTPQNKKAWVLGYCAMNAFNTHLPVAREIFELAEFDD